MSRMDDLLRGGSLDPAHLYVECEPCRLAGRGSRVARDPFDDDRCVYDHALTACAERQAEPDGNGRTVAP